MMTETLLRVKRVVSVAVCMLLGLLAAVPAAAQDASDLPTFVEANPAGVTPTVNLDTITIGFDSFLVGSGSAISVLDESTELTDAVTRFVFSGSLVHCSATGTVVTCAIGSGGTPPTPVPYNGYIGWSDDSTATAAELQAGHSFTTTTATIPPRADNGYLIFGLEAGWPSNLYFQGNAFDVLGGFTQQGTLDVGGTTHTVGVSNALQSATMIGTGSFTVRFVR